MLSLVKQETGATRVCCFYIFTLQKELFPITRIHKNMFLSIADECGEYSLTRGYYDYCLYLDSSKPDWLAQSWNQKMGAIMEEVLTERSDAIYPYEFLDGN